MAAHQQQQHYYPLQQQQQQQPAVRPLVQAQPAPLVPAAAAVVGGMVGAQPNGAISTTTSANHHHHLQQQQQQQQQYQLHQRSQSQSQLYAVDPSIQHSRQIIQHHQLQQHQLQQLYNQQQSQQQQPQPQPGYAHQAVNAPRPVYRTQTFPQLVTGSPMRVQQRPPIMILPAGSIPAGPITLISSPNQTRMPLTLTGANGIRPVFIAAGPPSIIKNPMRTKLLLERPVPRIEIKQRHNTLLANFWGDEIDVDKEGKVIDRTVVDAQRLEGDAKKRRRPKKNGIVVGIDFGNTFTAVSYAHQNDGEMIDIVKWPKQVSAYSKVPTVSLYKADKDRTFEDWGSSALASYKRSKTDRFLVQDYKILLFDQGARGQLQHGLHLTDAFIHYLRSVHRHILEEINKSQVVAAESVPIHYCITIPQSWTLPTRELVLRCYVEAGVIIQTPAVNMTVITEAEAAATYCREHCAEFETLEDKDTFIVCDAGGMTTHVTVFQVDDSLGVRQFMRLSSSHAENCGSVILDWNFKALVLERLAGIDIDAKPQRQKALETLLEGFTEIKCQFDASAVDEIKHVAVPLGLDVNELDPAPSWLEDEYMSLTGQELSEKVFDPVVTKVQLLIEEQLKNHPICAGLFLVGGLGSSKYLSHRLKTLLPTPLSESQPTSTHGRSSTSSRNGGPPAMLVKNVIMVQKAELAVARGAVIYGLKSASQHNKAFQ